MVVWESPGTRHARLGEIASGWLATIPSRVAVRARRLWWWLAHLAARWQWLAVPLTIALGSRAVVLLVGLAALSLIPDNAAYERVFRSAAYTAHPLLGPWYAWDASWYTAIALHGYQSQGPEAPSVAFWPLLPLLEAASARLLGVVAPHLTPALAVALAGLLVALIASCVGAALVYRLIAEDHGPHAARRAVALLAFAPGAVYLTAPYPEALLLSGVAGCLLALRHERWLLAGASGMCAALAQVPGCFLVLPFAWEYLHRRRGRVGWSALWIALIPLGPALWLGYLWMLTGDLLAPVTAALTYWPHRYAWPWETLFTSVQAIVGAAVWDPQDFLNLGATLAALGASLWALRAGYASWALWSLAALLLYLSVPAAEPLESMVRYVLPMLPLWLVGARITPHPALEVLAIGASAALLSLVTALFVNSYWIA